MSKSAVIFWVLGWILVGGCGAAWPAAEAPRFSAPLFVEGKAVSPAILDTGGGYEVLLREDFGLEVIGQARVLAFGGMETVDLTEGFTYSVGGIETKASFALTGLSICQCNGVGYPFFLKTGVVLGLDFAGTSATFLETLPIGGVIIPFVAPPESLAGFETAFVMVEVADGFDPPSAGNALAVRALLDTGANRTAMRRNFLPSDSALDLGTKDITIGIPSLGTVAANVILFDTPGLPELIIGTDVMGAWGDRWYFQFGPERGVACIHNDLPPGIRPSQSSE